MHCQRAAQAALAAAAAPRGSPDCPKGEGEEAPKGEDDAPKPPKAGALAAAPNAGALVAPKPPNAGAAGGRGGVLGGKAPLRTLGCRGSPGLSSSSAPTRQPHPQSPRGAPEAAPNAGWEAPKAGLLAAPNAGLLAGAPKGEGDAEAPKPEVPKAPPAGEAVPVLPLQPSCGAGGVLSAAQREGPAGPATWAAAWQQQWAHSAPHGAPHSAAPTLHPAPPLPHLIVLPPQLLRALAAVLRHAGNGVEEDDCGRGRWQGGG